MNPSVDDKREEKEDEQPKKNIYIIIRKRKITREKETGKIRDPSSAGDSSERTSNVGDGCLVNSVETSFIINVVFRDKLRIFQCERTALPLCID